jgi:hypothetical protein
MTKLIVLCVTLVACATMASAVVPKEQQHAPHLRFMSASAKAPAGAALAAAGDDDKEGGNISPDGHKPLSMAMKCVLTLLFMYFLVIVMLKTIEFKKQVYELYGKFAEDTGMKKAKVDEGEGEAAVAADTTEKSKGLMGGAVHAVADMFSENKLQMIMTNMALVPMFCILITFFRLRARVDLKTEPQKFAKTWMLISTICLVVQVFSVVLPQFPVSEDTSSGMRMCSKAWTYTLMIVNITGTALLYGGVGVIVYAIFTLRYEEDKYNAVTDAIGATAPKPSL